MLRSTSHKSIKTTSIFIFFLLWRLVVYQSSITFNFVVIRFKTVRFRLVVTAAHSRLGIPLAEHGNVNEMPLLLWLQVSLHVDRPGACNRQAACEPIWHTPLWLAAHWAPLMHYCSHPPPVSQRRQQSEHSRRKLVSQLRRTCIELHRSLNNAVKQKLRRRRQK